MSGSATYLGLVMSKTFPSLEAGKLVLEFDNDLNRPLRARGRKSGSVPLSLTITEK